MIIDSIVNEFRSIVGDEWFLDSPEDFAVYSYDGFLLSLLPAMYQDDQGEGEERKVDLGVLDITDVVVRAMSDA